MRILEENNCEKKDNKLYDVFKRLLKSPELNVIDKKVIRTKKIINNFLFLTDIYDLEDEEEEIEEYYEDYFFDILAYPPGSKPPNANNKQSLFPHFMILDSCYKN